MTFPIVSRATRASLAEAKEFFNCFARMRQRHEFDCELEAPYLNREPFGWSAALFKLSNGMMKKA